MHDPGGGGGGAKGLDGGGEPVGTQLTAGCDHWLFVHVIALTPNGVLRW